MAEGELSPQAWGQGYTCVKQQIATSVAVSPPGASHTLEGHLAIQDCPRIVLCVVLLHLLQRDVASSGLPI